MNSGISNNTTYHNFSHLESVIPIPDLLDIQLASFEDFLQEDVLPEKRENKGLEAVFKNMFPVEDTHRNYVLEYKHYYLGLPKYTVKECLERRISYALPLKIRFVLHITDENDKSKYVQDIEQDVFFGNIPFMTKSGTFVINGAERVIVSQLQRSPGVFFDQSFHPNGTKIFQARIIPFRGSWVDFTTDIYDCIYAIIDRRRKFPATLLLRALGFSTNKDIFSSFGLTEKIKLSKKAALKGKSLIEDFVNEDTGEIDETAHLEWEEDLEHLCWIIYGEHEITEETECIDEAEWNDLQMRHKDDGGSRVQNLTIIDDVIDGII